MTKMAKRRVPWVALCAASLVLAGPVRADVSSPGKEIPPDGASVSPAAPGATAAALAANDSCANATVIDPPPFTDAIDTTQATTDARDPFSGCACGQNSHSVWYRFTAERSGEVTVDTTGSNYDTVLSVFVGTCGASDPVPCNDDSNGTLQSQVRFQAVAGTTYFIEVTSFCGGPAGNLRLDFESGELLSGRSIQVRDHAGDPRKRKLVLSSRDPALETAAPGTPGDPRVDGAFLSLVNPTTGETDVIHLPATRWTGLGTPAGITGYGYSDPGHEDGPCSNVILKAGNLRATCSGAGIDFTLDEPAQNSLEFRLTTGPAAYCLLFGGVVSNDKPAVDAASGTFKAADAPAPGSCPISPASCEGLCGASAETCFCDAACVDNGDCCADFADFCQP